MNGSSSLSLLETRLESFLESSFNKHENPPSPSTCTVLAEKCGVSRVQAVDVANWFRMRQSGKSPTEATAAILKYHQATPTSSSRKELCFSCVSLTIGSYSATAQFLGEVAFWMMFYPKSAGQFYVVLNETWIDVCNSIRFFCCTGGGASCSGCSDED